MSEPLSPPALALIEELNANFKELTGADALAKLPPHEAAGVLHALSVNLAVIALFWLNAGLRDEGASEDAAEAAIRRFVELLPGQVLKQATTVGDELLKRGPNRV